MRKLLFYIILVCLVGSVSAQAPELDVRPDPVEENTTVDEVSEVDVTFENLDNSKKAINVTLRSKDWLSWSDPSKFNISAGGLKTRTAEINESAPPSFVNESVTYPFKFNDSDGDVTFNKNDYPSNRFLVNSSYSEVNVSLDTLTTNFELGLGERDSGFFSIKNLGGSRAYDVEFEGEYVQDYSDEGFNIEGGGSSNVQYFVEVPRPDDDQDATDATNQTYKTSVTVRGENFGSKSFPVSIEVPYKDYSQDFEEGDFDGLFKSFEQFCSNNPSECNITDTVTETNTVVKNRTVPVESNLTKEDIAKLKKLADQGAGNTENIEQEINLLKTLIKNRFQSQENKLNDAQTRAREAEMEANRTRALLENITEQRKERKESASQTFIMLFIGLVLGGFGIGGGYYFYQMYKRRNDFRVIPE